MRIKHFAGYGCVNARKVKNNSCTLRVRVSGNHEWGLERNDLYDAYNWLVKRFDKSVPEYLEWRRSVIRFNCIPGWDEERKEETCDYVFVYGKES